MAPLHITILLVSSFPSSSFIPLSVRSSRKHIPLVQAIGSLSSTWVSTSPISPEYCPSIQHRTRTSYHPHVRLSSSPEIKATPRNNFDFSSRVIISDKIHVGNGFPMLTIDEQQAATALILKFNPFRDSIKRRGLDVLEVVVTSSTIGWFGEKHTERLIKAMLFYLNGSVNPYLRPIEGMRIIVTLTKWR
ncbi:Amine oxidase [Raphanus sativus]|nr:Amine oxidase [Raphanus sativus]